jgi:Coenzyme PQQ synthesis protein D (PqqD)
MSDLPSRVDDIDLVEVSDGFVVYHPARDRVHFFNHTAAIVLELCDGTKSDAEIASLVQRCYELPEPPQTEVAGCVAQLREEGLVT